MKHEPPKDPRPEVPTLGAAQPPADMVTSPRTLVEDSGVLSQQAAPVLPVEPLPSIVSLLGRGGMGRVYTAEDRPLERDVALKVLGDDVRGDARLREAFIAEARVTGQLQHPNIVPVYALATEADGAPFFTMQVIEGRNLHQWLSHPERPPGSRERLERGLEIFLRVCDAVAFAHSRGVLHRDIKPANIMVGAYGRVYMMDWGLAVAKEAHGRKAAPHQGHEGVGIVGTPSYMAPEQARNERLDERADVFGLGAVLYEIVTGAPPYGRDEPQRILARAIAGSVVPLDELPESLGLAPGIRKIVSRAVARSPEDRYPSVEALQDDVRAFLQGGMHLPRLEYAEGDVIVRQGEPGDAAYVIERGSCHVLQVVDGREATLRTMTAGDIFGELALLLDAPRSATVIAAEPTTLLVLDRRALESSGVFHGFSAALLKALAVRFRDLESRTRHGRDK